MATQAVGIAMVKRSKPRRVKPRIVETVYGSRTLQGAEAEVLRLHVSRGMQERREWEDQLRALARRPGPQEAPAMRVAMQAVEQRIVRGLWVIEISEIGDGPRQQRQHGLGYMPEAVDRIGEAVAKGGWQAPSPRPPIPSSKEIDAAREAQRWIEWLDDGQARLLTVAAGTKRGDRQRRVNWDRVKAALRLPDATPLRTLQERYDRALRTIVAELTLARVG